MMGKNAKERHAQTEGMSLLNLGGNVSLTILCYVPVALGLVASFFLLFKEWWERRAK